MGNIEHVLVVGGGVGGLTAALAFAQRGVAVTLVERRSEFEVAGVGLGQPANALRVYDALGLLEQVLDAGFVYDGMRIFDPNRELIAEHRFLLGDERVPAVCALARSELHEILFTAARAAGVTFKMATTVDAIEERPDGIDVTLSDGTQSSYDLLAGFDGIRSTVRQHVVGDAFVPRPSGFGAWRVQIPRPDDVVGMEFLQGVGSKTGAMPLSHDLMYLFHIRPEAPDSQFERSERLDLLRDRMSQYGSYVAEALVALTPESDIVYSPLEPLLVPWPWHRGRVVIGGDAAHVTPPHLPQGAAMAVEAAYLLACAATDPAGSLEERLFSWSQERWARCAFVYSFSRQWLEDEQSIKTSAQLHAAKAEMARNASARIAASDRILNTRVLPHREANIA